MARVRLPEGQQRSGSQGGIVWSRNRYGPYIRERANPVNPNTARQVVVRNYLGGLSTRWNSTVTEAQREAWRLYALNTPLPGAFGEQTVLAGKDMYIRGNANRLIAGLTEIDDGPTTFGLPYPVAGFAVTASESTQQISMAFETGVDFPGTDDSAAIVYLGAPQNPSRNYFGGPYRLAGSVEGDATTPPESPQTFTAPWPIAEGQRIWARSRFIDADGRLSDWATSVFLCSS